MKRTLCRLLPLLLFSPLLLSAGIRKEGDTVLLQSDRLNVSFRAGIVTGIEDRKTGESFIHAPEGMLVPENLAKESLLPPASGAFTFEKRSENEATAVYECPNGVTLIYEFGIDGDDIRIGQKLKNYDMMDGKNRLNMDLHVPFLTPDAVITGIGNRILRSEPEHREQLLWPGSGFFFPRVAVAEGKKGTLLFYNESSLPYHNFVEVHTPEFDHFILRSGARDLMRKTGRPLQFPKGELSASAWRISAHETWVQAAKAWRKHFERSTGARPLWENPAPAVRKIHAFFTGSPSENWKEDPDEFYSRIAEKYDPESLLLLYWNSGSIIMLGDPRYVLRPYPTEKAVDSLHRHGFKWMGFHGFTLLHANDARMADRLERVRRQKQLPEDYVFTPAWQGKPEEFLPFMKQYGYGMEKREWALLHPAAKAVQDYVSINIRKFAEEHRTDGFYLDVTAAVHYGIPDELLCLEGGTFYDGDVAAFRRLRKDAPDLFFMTEYAGEWCIPYAFWHWEGTLVFGNTKVRINHPFRAALYASYAWARESTTHPDPVKNILFGTLPEVVWGAGSAHLEDALTDVWYNERAKLFVDRKLFYDLPEKWEEGALAYFRTDGTDQWTTFRKMPFGYAFVREGKVLLGLYENTPKGIPGFEIPSWCAYDDQGAAIGLNPACRYGFVRPEAIEKKPPIRIHSLPDGVFCRSIRRTEYAFCAELDSAEPHGEILVPVSFTKPPVRVYVNGKEQPAGCSEFRIALPGSITVIEKEPPRPVDLSTVRRDINGYSANARAFRFANCDVNGLPGSVGFRGWASSFTSSLVQSVRMPNGVRVGLGVGAARFSGAAECFTVVPADKPVLFFDLAMPLNEKGLSMGARILVNGVPVWSEEIPCLPEWSPRSVDLRKFAGQTVLLTFEYGHRDPRRSDGLARKDRNRLYFGDIRFGQQPESGK